MSTPPRPPGPQPARMPVRPADRRYQRPAPTVAPKSKTLIVVRLLVAFGALAISAAVVIVFMLTKQPEPEPAPPVVVSMPSPQAPAPKSAPKQAPTATGLLMESLAKDSGRWAGELAGAADKLPELHAAALTAAAGRLRAEASSMKGERDALDPLIESARRQVAEVETRIEPLEAKADALSEKEWPLDAFVSTFQRTLELDAERESARAVAREKAAALEQASAKLEAALAAAEARMDADDFEKYAQAVDEAANAEDFARQERDAALANERRVDEESALTAARLRDLSTDLKDHPEMADQWKAYQVAVAEAAELDVRLATAEAKVESMLQEIDDLVVEVDELLDVYRTVHKKYLEAASDLAAAQSKWQRAESNSARYKAEMDRAADVKAQWEQKDRAAKANLNESRAELSKLRRDHKKEAGAMNAIYGQRTDAVGKTAQARDALGKRLAPVGARINSEKAARDAELARVEAQIETLEEERDVKLAALVALERKSTELHNGITGRLARAEGINRVSLGATVPALRKAALLLEALGKAERVYPAQVQVALSACAETAYELQGARDGLAEHAVDGPEFTQWSTELEKAQATVAAARSVLLAAARATERK